MSPLFFRSYVLLLLLCILPMSLFAEPKIPQEKLAEGVRMAAFFLTLSLLPLLLMAATSFVRVLIVLSFFRKALSGEEILPPVALLALSFVLSLLVMLPVLKKLHQQVWIPWEQGKLTDSQALEKGLNIWKLFMLGETEEKQILLFAQMTRQTVPAKKEEIPLEVLFPAFVAGEVGKALKMGVWIYFPFLLVDLLLALCLAIFQLNLPLPVVSLPCKLAIFLAADGWNLLIQGLVKSFHTW